MTRIKRPVILLVAEDDDDDFMLTKQALDEAHVLNDLSRVEDGEELMDYLNRRAGFKDPASSPEPALILLDLNMPKKDGREALREIKTDPHLRHLPVVVLTTSNAEEDIVRTYQLGVNSFIKKPVTFVGLVQAITVLGRYWFEIVELPPAS